MFFSRENTRTKFEDRKYIFVSSNFLVDAEKAEAAAECAATRWYVGALIALAVLCALLLAILVLLLSTRARRRLARNRRENVDVEPGDEALEMLQTPAGPPGPLGPPCPPGQQIEGANEGEVGPQEAQEGRDLVQNHGPEVPLIPGGVNGDGEGTMSPPSTEPNRAASAEAPLLPIQPADDKSVSTEGSAEPTTNAQDVRPGEMARARDESLEPNKGGGAGAPIFISTTTSLTPVTEASQAGTIFDKIIDNS